MKLLHKNIEIVLMIIDTPDIESDLKDTHVSSSSHDTHVSSSSVIAAVPAGPVNSSNSVFSLEFINSTMHFIMYSHYLVASMVRGMPLRGVPCSFFLFCCSSVITHACSREHARWCESEKKKSHYRFDRVK
jgi:hypothetical protein